MTKDTSLPETDILSETNNYIIWTAEEPDGELTYHLELNNVTLHFFQEEWNELLELMQAVEAKKS